MGIHSWGSETNDYGSFELLRDEDEKMDVRLKWGNMTGSIVWKVD